MGLVSLRDYQRDAVKRMRNGCILCGGVGSGKSRTALAYYYICNGGSLDAGSYKEMKNPKDLYIITTARKRDTLEWESEMAPFLITTHDEFLTIYNNKVVVDSWNNIKKYVDVKGAFFIFDEQHVCGYGEWTKTFLKITKANEWILLSATPGDQWSDYAPVFIANGFYKNITQFRREHCVYSKFTNFPRIDKYINTRRLVRLRDRILINMEFERPTASHHEDIYTSYDKVKYKELYKNRWNPLTNEPIKNASEFCYILRKLVNLDESRIIAVLEIFEKHPRVIIFYNFDAELELLKSIEYGKDVEVAEWNSHKHQPIPESKSWVYLVQYNAAEAWNCIKTDTIIFYSQNYSYKAMVQASGRIDRLNTPYKDLYYYHLKSHSGIDMAINKALKNKKKFNEKSFYEGRNL